MTTIRSDTEFKNALSALSLDQQRRIAKRFVERVMDLADNPKIGKCLAIADEADIPARELSDNFTAAKSAAIESYTLCGREADWSRQASHFVAAATAACLAPPDQSEQCRNLAWTTAMNARMARVCANVAAGSEPDDSETTGQYALLTDFLKTLHA